MASEKQNTEIDRLNSEMNYNLQTKDQAEHERQQMQSQIHELKSKIQTQMTELTYKQNEIEEHKNEVLMLKQQNSMSLNMQEQLKSQLFEQREKL